MTMVIDANVLVKWFVEEEGSDQARTLRGRSLVAPDLIIVETANILWKKVRADGFDAADVGYALKLIQHSKIVLTPSLDLAQRAFEIGHVLDHAVYDCFYLALAEARGIPFVMADAKLQRKLAARGSASHARITILSDLTNLN